MTLPESRHLSAENQESNFLAGDMPDQYFPESHPLGLSIFKLLVEMQGGTVFVKSVQGRGSVFGCTLKFGLDQQVAIAQPVANNFSAPLSLPGPVNLLLVDAEPMNIFIALKYLEICDNIHVTAADNGKNALQMIKHQVVQVH